MRRKLSHAVLVLLLAATFSFTGCDEGGRVGKAAKAPVPATAVPSPVESGLPISPRAWSPGSLAAPAKPGPAILADAVETLLVSAQQDAKAGHLPEARRDYDRALAWLVSSGYDLRTNARLGELHGRVVAESEALELAAGDQGKPPVPAGEAEAQPAAIDEIPDVVNPVDPKLKKRAEQDMASLRHDLPLTATDPVLSYLNFFETSTRGRAIVARGLRRAGRYREMIARILREEGVPQDLIYVAQAESAFEPLALSRARALGIWQFVAGSGTKYGLDHTWWVDERRDPEKSTRAAARYLRDLYGMFGDWYLAMAAYNTGEGNVVKAVERTGYADFWELYRRNALLKQTRNYVPIILALAMIAKDPAKHGILFEQDEPLRCDVVKPGHALDLRLAADAIGEDIGLLKALNPQLLRTVTPPDPGFELRLPEGSAEQFTAELATIPPEKWVLWRRHEVAPGESLATVAHRYGVTPAAIALVNGLGGLKANAPLEAGQRLTIPANRPSPTGLGQLVRYRVRRGDTLGRLARQFDVTPGDIVRWNAPHGASLKPGTTLKIYPGGRLSAVPTSQKTLKKQQLDNRVTDKTESPEGPVTHSVQPGETLWSIAREYGTTVEALEAANPFLSGRSLQAGDQLKILVHR